MKQNVESNANILNSPNNHPRINVVCLGARDYYHVAAALNAAGQLGKLITDFYTPNFLRGAIGSRFHPNLDSSRTIHLPVFSILQIFARRVLSADLRRKAQRLLIDRAFGFVSAAITYVGPNRAVVYSYYLEGFVLFYRMIGKRPLQLICFQVHPTSPYIRRQLDGDVVLFESFLGAKKFSAEPEQDEDEVDLASYKLALSYCSKYICASSATVRSVNLICPDLPGTVIPYGSKLQTTSLTTRLPRNQGDPIRLITICQLVQRKGMHWAFAAMSSLPANVRSKFRWVIVANSFDNIIKDMAPDNATFVSGLSDCEIGTTLAEADLFVMPSLIEGFGLVYIESLSVGTPILYTTETGAADLCVSGVHGFEVACSDSQQIAEIFAALSSNPDVLVAMRQRASDLAKEITWSDFHSKIQSACRDATLIAND